MYHFVARSFKRMGIMVPMRDRDIHRAVVLLRRGVRRFKPTAVGEVARRRDPFLVLVSTLISLRTKDAVTDAASRRLFRLARTPRSLARLPRRAVEKAIYPASFYRNKARTLRAVSRELIRRFEGRVPGTIEELLTFKGVGRKTANLVVTLGFGRPGICVDTHVHRIFNRWGYVRTRTPDETETALRAKLPRRYWIGINDLLVAYGQNLCAPVSPWCSRCALKPLCARRGVSRSR